MLGGSNSPSFRIFDHCSRTAFSASAVRFVIKSSVNRWRVNGGGSAGRNCVDETCSPSTSDAGG